MRIEFHVHGQTLTKDLREHAEASLRRALRRFARRVGRVRVYLWDANGPRGGVDQGVRLIVELLPAGEVLVRETDENAFAAVAAAVSRARYAVRRELRRRWDRSRRVAQRGRPFREQTAALAVSS
jgi:hypothetical protein